MLDVKMYQTCYPIFICSPLYIEVFSLMSRTSWPPLQRINHFFLIRCNWKVSLCGNIKADRVGGMLIADSVEFRECTVKLNVKCLVCGMLDQNNTRTMYAFLDTKDYCFILTFWSRMAVKKFPSVLLSEVPQMWT